MNLNNDPSSNGMNENWQSSLENLINNIKKFGIEDNNKFQPEIDIWEDEKNIHLDLELPGVARKDLEIKFENNILSVNGEKKSLISENDNIKFYKKERVFGTFSKNFTLPDGINSSLIEAKLENGMLQIVVPKVKDKEVKERIIEVK